MAVGVGVPKYSSDSFAVQILAGVVVGSAIGVAYGGTDVAIGDVSTMVSPEVDEETDCSAVGEDGAIKIRATRPPLIHRPTSTSSRGWVWLLWKISLTTIAKSLNNSMSTPAAKSKSAPMRLIAQPTPASCRLYRRAIFYLSV